MYATEPRRNEAVAVELPAVFIDGPAATFEVLQPEAPRFFIPGEPTWSPQQEAEKSQITPIFRGEGKDGFVTEISVPGVGIFRFVYDFEMESYEWFREVDRDTWCAYLEDDDGPTFEDDPEPIAVQPEGAALAPSGASVLAPAVFAEGLEVAAPLHEADAEEPARPEPDDRLYRIAEWNYDALVERVDRLAARAARLGVAPISLTIVARETEAPEPLPVTKRPFDLIEGDATVEDDEPLEAAAFGPSITWLTIRVEGGAPVIAVWRFVGTIQHEATGNIFHALPGEAIDEAYRSAAPYCDHCQTTRSRKDTYL